MEKDASWAMYFKNDERYADFVNATMGEGLIIVKKEDVLPCDNKVLINDKKTGRKRTLHRDATRRLVMGINFCIVDLEPQEVVDYGYPLRDMGYAYGEYATQARKIRHDTRSEEKHYSPGERMYGFKKESKLRPTVIFLLYSGIKEWDGAKSIKEMLDMTGMPVGMEKYINDYRINLIDIRRLSDEEIKRFRTDVGKVFNFIKHSQDKEKLKQLLETDEYYANMEEDAYDVVANYASVRNVKKKKYVTKEGGINMCKAIDDMIEEGKQEVAIRMQMIIDNRDKTIEEKDKAIDEKDKTIEEKDKIIEELKRQLEKNGQMKN